MLRKERDMYNKTEGTIIGETKGKWWVSMDVDGKIVMWKKKFLTTIGVEQREAKEIDLEPGVNVKIVNLEHRRALNNRVGTIFDNDHNNEGVFYWIVRLFPDIQWSKDINKRIKKWQDNF